MSINYTLAKELKDSGFPQSNHDDETCTASVGLGCHCGSYIPTLEELIDACGDKLLSFGRMEGKDGIVAWIARPHPRTETGDFMAATPTEAVAMLWLALHKK